MHLYRPGVERQCVLVFTFCSLVAHFGPDSLPKDICLSTVGSSAAFRRLFAIDFQIHALYVCITE